MTGIEGSLRLKDCVLWGGDHPARASSAGFTHVLACGLLQQLLHLLRTEEGSGETQSWSFQASDLIAHATEVLAAAGPANCQSG